MQSQPLRNFASFNRLLGSVALLVAISTASLPAQANLIFDWSFTNGTDTVAGQIFGLVDDTAGQQATSVTVTSGPLPPGALLPKDFSGVTGASFGNNTFTVASGMIMFSHFDASIFVIEGVDLYFYDIWLNHNFPLDPAQFTATNLFSTGPDASTFVEASTSAILYAAALAPQ